MKIVDALYQFLEARSFSEQAAEKAYACDDSAHKFSRWVASPALGMVGVPILAAVDAVRELAATILSAVPSVALRKLKEDSPQFHVKKMVKHVVVGVTAVGLGAAPSALLIPLMMQLGLEVQAPNAKFSKWAVLGVAGLTGLALGVYLFGTSFLTQRLMTVSMGHKHRLIAFGTAGLTGLAVVLGRCILTTSKTTKAAPPEPSPVPPPSAAPPASKPSQEKPQPSAPPPPSKPSTGSTISFRVPSPSLPPQPSPSFPPLNLNHHVTLWPCNHVLSLSNAEAQFGKLLPVKNVKNPDELPTAANPEKNGCSECSKPVIGYGTCHKIQDLMQQMSLMLTDCERLEASIHSLEQAGQGVQPKAEVVRQMIDAPNRHLELKDAWDDRCSDAVTLEQIKNPVTLWPCSHVLDVTGAELVFGKPIPAQSQAGFPTTEKRNNCPTCQSPVVSYAGCDKIKQLMAPGPGILQRYETLALEANRLAVKNSGASASSPSVPVPVEPQMPEIPDVYYLGDIFDCNRPWSPLNQVEQVKEQVAKNEAEGTPFIKRRFAFKHRGYMGRQPPLSYVRVNGFIDPRTGRAFIEVFISSAHPNQFRELLQQADLTPEENSSRMTEACDGVKYAMGTFTAKTEREIRWVSKFIRNSNTFADDKDDKFLAALCENPNDWRAVETQNRAYVVAGLGRLQAIRQEDQKKERAKKLEKVLQEMDGKS